MLTQELSCLIHTQRRGHERLRHKDRNLQARSRPLQETSLLAPWLWTSSLQTVRNQGCQVLSIWYLCHGGQSWRRQWPLSVYSCVAEVLFICFSWGFLFCFTYIKFIHALIIWSLKFIKCFLSISWDGHVWPVTLANDVMGSQSWIPDEPSSVLGHHPLYINTPRIHILHTGMHAWMHTPYHTHTPYTTVMKRTTVPQLAGRSP